MHSKTRLSVVVQRIHILHHLGHHTHGKIDAVIVGGAARIAGQPACKSRRIRCKIKTNQGGE